MDIENTVSSTKTEKQKNYNKTASVRIPKMEILKKIFVDEDYSIVYLVNYKGKNIDNGDSS